MAFTLTLNIDPTSLNSINGAGKKIALAQRVVNAPPTAPPIEVVWITFDAFESNTIEWNENFGLYASDTAIAANKKIALKEEATSPVVGGSFYPFFTNGEFLPPVESPAIPVGTYAAQNLMPTPVTFGLTLAAEVNGLVMPFKPISANSVQNKAMVLITPSNIVDIWIADEGQDAATTMLTSPIPNTASATFSASTPEITMAYDATSKVFSQIQPPTKPPTTPPTKPPTTPPTKPPTKPPSLAAEKRAKAADKPKT